MAILFLVRHAQASFLELNYDKLSQLGEAQARLLGEYWAKRNVVFDRVCVGPRVRQKDTARLVSEAFERNGLTFPQPMVLSEFDEYKGEVVLATRYISKVIRGGHWKVGAGRNQSARGRGLAAILLPGELRPL
jgi:phosphohistidine phosphatase SixA